MHNIKKLFSVLTLFSFNLAFAQTPPDSATEPTLMSKRGEPILPEAKDWALSVDASPFLTYTGKLLSTTGSDAPAVNALANYPLTIGGKYFISSKQAYRARVRIGVFSQ